MGRSRYYLLLMLLVFVAGCRTAGPDLVVQPQDPALVMRGATLAKGLAACGFCHGEPTDPDAPLSGGRVMADKFGALEAPNITPSQSGIGTWTTNELLKVLRAAEGKDERLLSTELHRGYEWVSDPDALAIIAFIRSQAPINNEVERREIGFISRNTTGFFDRSREVRGYVPSIARRFGPEYGQYLVNHLARCQTCHNSEGSLLAEERYLSGGKLVKFDNEERRAPSLLGGTVEGLGSWSEADIVNYLRTATTPVGRVSDPRFCPTSYYARAPEEDVLAIARYLKSLPSS